MKKLVQHVGFSRTSTGRNMTLINLRKIYWIVLLYNTIKELWKYKEKTPKWCQLLGNIGRVKYKSKFRLKKVRGSIFLILCSQAKTNYWLRASIMSKEEQKKVIGASSSSDWVSGIAKADKAPVNLTVFEMAGSQYRSLFASFRRKYVVSLEEPGLYSFSNAFILRFMKSLSW